MAAFSNFYFFAPSALSRRAARASGRVTRRRAIYFGEFALRVRGAAGEFVLLLWTVSVLAFSALVMASFFLG